MKIAQTNNIGDKFFGTGTFLQKTEDVGTLTTNHAPCDSTLYIGI